MNRIQTQFVKDAMDNEELLSDWENGFISDIAEYDDDKPLSEKQNSILNRISQKINRN